MNEQNGGFIENGSVISPRHFIYLDRSRLFSYTAQLSDGLPHLRSLLESVGHSKLEVLLNSIKRKLMKFLAMLRVVLELRQSFRYQVEESIKGVTRRALRMVALQTNMIPCKSSRRTRLNTIIFT